MMGDLMREFKIRRRRWAVDVFFEFAFMIAFFVTYFTNGSTNSLIFYAVMFLSSKIDAQKTYEGIMELRPTHTKEERLE